MSGAAGTGIANSGWATVVIENSLITNNTSWSEGGCSHSLGSMTIRNSIVSNNTATGRVAGDPPPPYGQPGNGGGIFTRGHLAIENSQVVGNRALLDGQGGGIYRSQLSNLVLTDTDVTGNTATLGGGMYPFSTTGLTSSAAAPFVGTPQTTGPTARRETITAR